MAAVNQWQLPLDGLDQARSPHRMLMDRKCDCPHSAAVQHCLADMIAAEPGKDSNSWRQAEQHVCRHFRALVCVLPIRGSAAHVLAGVEL